MTQLEPNGKPSDSPGEAAPASSAHVGDVTALINAFRVLLIYIVHQHASGPENPVDPRRRFATDGEQAAPLPAEIHVELLSMSPEEIARNSSRLQHLYSSIQVLAGLAAPASVESICLTSAFLGDYFTLNPPPRVKATARRLRWWAVATLSAALMVFVVTLLLLTHVVRGQAAIRQLELARSEHALIAGAVSRLQLHCRTAVDLAEPTVASSSPPALCDQLQDASRNLLIAQTELRAWNAITDHLPLPRMWFQRQVDLPPGLSDRQWEGSELRASLFLTGFAGFGLPVLLGALGSFTYVYRDIGRQLRNATLTSGDAWFGSLRMLLGTILAGLLGVIWTSGPVIKFEGVSLSLTALAFLVGYSVEPAFRFLDTMVAKLTNAVAK